MTETTLDAQADGNFGGKHESVNRRAGYTDSTGWTLRIARKGGTLAAGEGLLLIKHYEQIIAELQQEIDGLTHELREVNRAITHLQHY